MSLRAHANCFNFVDLEMSEEEKDLPYICTGLQNYIRLLLKHCFIAGSSKCTTKDLSCLLSTLLSTIKDRLIRYCATETSHNWLNNMWILKNSTCLLSLLDQLDVCTATSMQTNDFSTLYTSIPHKLLKS